MKNIFFLSTEFKRLSIKLKSKSNLRINFNFSGKVPKVYSLILAASLLRNKEKRITGNKIKNVMYLIKYLSLSFFSLILCKRKRDTQLQSLWDAIQIQVLLKYKYVITYYLQPMRKSFLLVALFLMTYMFLFYNYQGVNNKNGKKLFMFLPKETIFPSFPKVSWALSALQNNKWMPCSLLLLKSFLFMPVIQGLCFDCSWEMKTLSCWWINTATFKIGVCKLSLKPLWNALQKH